MLEYWSSNNYRVPSRGDPATVLLAMARTSRKGKLVKMLRDLTTRPEFKKFFQDAGRKGGLIGGKLLSERMSPEERTARARLAAQARWGRPEMSSGEARPAGPSARGRPAKLRTKSKKTSQTKRRRTKQP
jgi:hypothetical protein